MCLSQYSTALKISNQSSSNIALSLCFSWCEPIILARPMQYSTALKIFNQFSSNIVLSLYFSWCVPIIRARQYSTALKICNQFSSNIVLSVCYSWCVPIILARPSTPQLSRSVTSPRTGVQIYCQQTVTGKEETWS